MINKDSLTSFGSDMVIELSQYATVAIFSKPLMHFVHFGSDMVIELSQYATV